jgi:hypothetical protein
MCVFSYRKENEVYGYTVVYVHMFDLRIYRSLEVSIGVNNIRYRRHQYLISGELLFDRENLNNYF